MIFRHLFWFMKLYIHGDSIDPFHGSSEGHEMLKRNDKYHSIADDVPNPKM